jgi:hypothetical protein
VKKNVYHCFVFEGSDLVRIGETPLVSDLYGGSAICPPPSSSISSTTSKSSMHPQQATVDYQTGAPVPMSYQVNKIWFFKINLLIDPLKIKCKETVL